MSYSTYNTELQLGQCIIRCPYSKCHARIIKPSEANLTTIHHLQTGIDYLKVNAEQPTQHDGHFIKVDDVWDFDNIGVSRSFEQPEPEKNVSGVKLERLIICSECERGPLGFATFEDGQSDVKDLKYYLHLNSVVYDQL